VHCDLKLLLKIRAFNSLLQVIMNAIVTYPFYKEATRTIDCKIINLAEKLLMDGKMTAIAKFERAQILRNVSIFQSRSITF